MLSRFAARDTMGFDRIYAFAPGRELLREALKDSVLTVADSAVVLRQDGDTALLLLGGNLLYGNSGDETSTAGAFAGLYRARQESGLGWRLENRLPLEAQNRVRAHRIWATLEPGVGLRVIDSITLENVGPNGGALRLNRKATIYRVAVNGSEGGYHFRSGVLWFDADSAAVVEVVISYFIDVSQDSMSEPNSGRFAPEFGHLRNQYFWHPFIWFDDRAEFQLVVDAPTRWHVASDLPQQVTILDGRRIVRARSQGPVAALSLFYDAGWTPVTRQSGAARVTLFATPEFQPSIDSISFAFAEAVRVLSARFGPPGSGYVAVVQQRARPVGSAGWPFMTNAVIAANWNGGRLVTLGQRPRAFFGHEVAHAWTRPTGSLRNMLMEGWATFAEASLLREVAGDSVVRQFWSSQREQYFAGGFEGRIALSEDVGNGGVSYSKGAWVLKMLESAIGAERFNSGFRAFSERDGSAGDSRATFIAEMSRAAGRDLSRFLAPWLDGRHVPQIAVEQRNRRWFLRQIQPGTPFVLEVPVALISGTDTTMRTVRTEGPETEIVHLQATTPIDAILIDPDQTLLLRRESGN